jgi:hypothetical protein
MRTYWQAIKSLPGFKGAALEKLLGFGEADGMVRPPEQRWP